MTDIKKHHEFIVDEIIDLIDTGKIAGVDAPESLEISSAAHSTDIPITITDDDGKQTHYTLSIELTAEEEQESDED